MKQAGERARSCSSRVGENIRHHPAVPHTGRIKQRIETHQEAGKWGRAGEFGRRSREETPEE